MDEIATLSQVDIRKVWPGEASHFAPWLAESADLLGEALGMDLAHEHTEAKVGRYSADLVFREASTGKLVVVENMFSTTNHDHLGKLLTYAAGLEAGYAVLIAPEFRDEHCSALNWLDSICTEDFGFFGIVLKAWRIGDSSPAPRLRVEVKPDDWSHFIRTAHSSGLTETQQAYQRFWSEFLPVFRDAYPGWNRATKPSKVAWMSFPSTRSGLLKHNAVFCRPDGKYRLRVEAYIDGGDADANKNTFDTLHEKKPQIERAVGGPLEWARLDSKRASRISLYFPTEIRISNEERWSEARNWLVQAMGKMRSAFGPVLEGLPK